MVKKDTATSPTLVLIEWKSRTAGFHNTDIATILTKACAHFGLGPDEKQYALMGDIDGREYELTDDTLKTLPNGAFVTLSELYDSKETLGCKVEDDAESTISGGTYHSYKPVNVPYYKPFMSPPLSFGPSYRLAGDPLSAAGRPAPLPTYSNRGSGAPNTYSFGQPTPFRGGASAPTFFPNTCQGFKQSQPNAPWTPPNPGVLGGPPMGPSLTSDAEMQINIDMYGKIVPVYIRPSDTVRTLKSKIQDKEGIPSSMQMLLFAGFPLDDAKTLAYHGVQHPSTITLTGAMTVPISANGFSGWP